MSTNRLDISSALTFDFSLLRNLHSIGRCIASQMKLLEVLTLLCLFCQNVIGYKFLAVLPITSRSHFYIGQNLMKGLADEGHEVTVISPFKVNKPIANYHEVFLENSWEMSRKSIVLNNRIA